jgi:hypothetical protein
MQASILEFANLQNLQEAVLEATTATANLPSISTDFSFSGKVYVYDDKSKSVLTE